MDYFYEEKKASIELSNLHQTAFIPEKIRYFNSKLIKIKANILIFYQKNISIFKNKDISDRCFEIFLKMIINKSSQKNPKIYKNHKIPNLATNLSSATYACQNKNFNEIFFPNKYRKKIKKILKFCKTPLWFGYFLKKIKYLNPVQTHVVPSLISFDGNLVISAPTGSGKTLLAIFSILRIIMNSIFFTGKKSVFILKKIKVVYIAPMKTLVRQVYKKLKSVFLCINLTILEMTGDKSVSFKDFVNSNICIGTPEKIHLTNKQTKSEEYLVRTKLLIIDEIHLLNEKRGSVLENFMINFLSYSSPNTNLNRIIGLSATFPNYIDLGNFIKASLTRGIFYFDRKYRPFDINFSILGFVKQKNYENKNSILNNILCEKIKKKFSTDPDSKIIVFVQSRRDTYKTGFSLIDYNSGYDCFKIKKKLTKSKVIHLNSLIDTLEIKKLLPFGISIHHAGLSRKEKVIIETLFKKNYISILISTSTLAWGANLYANTVFIKGTKIYNPEVCSWIEKTPSDIIQMLGRGGRDSNSRNSEGIIMTSFDSLNFYSKLLKYKAPVESHIISDFPDFLNTKFSKNKKSFLKNLIFWLFRSFFYIRLKRIVFRKFNDMQIGLRKMFLKKIFFLSINQSINELISIGFVKINLQTKEIRTTYLGRIAAKFTISYETILTLLSKIDSSSSIDHIMSIFSHSIELKYLTTKSIEKTELESLENKISTPIVEEINTTCYKIKVLLQAYIGNLRIKNLSLSADSLFIGKFGIRFFRALFEISILKRWAKSTNIVLQFYLSIKNRFWSNKPFLNKSFKITVKKKFLEIIKKSISKPVSRTRFEKVEETLKFYKKYPFINNLHIESNLSNVTFSVYPITSRVMKINFFLDTNVPKKNMNIKSKMGCWVFIEDIFSDILISIKYFSLNNVIGKKKIIFSQLIALGESPMSPYYFLRVNFTGFNSPDLELKIDLTRIKLPNTIYKETWATYYPDFNASRYFSGFKYSSLICQYFNTNLRRLKGKIQQFFLFYPKSSKNNILVSKERLVRNFFSEMILLSNIINRTNIHYFNFILEKKFITSKLKSLKKTCLGYLCVPIRNNIYRASIYLDKKEKRKCLDLISYVDLLKCNKLIDENRHVKSFFFLEPCSLPEKKILKIDLEFFLENFFKIKKFSIVSPPILNYLDLCKRTKIKILSGIKLNESQRQSNRVKKIYRERQNFLFIGYGFDLEKKNIYRYVLELLIKNLKIKIFSKEHYLFFFYRTIFKNNFLNKILFLFDISIVDNRLFIDKKSLTVELQAKKIFHNLLSDILFYSFTSIVKFKNKIVIFNEYLSFQAIREIYDILNNNIVHRFKFLKYYTGLIVSEISSFSDNSYAESNWIYFRKYFINLKILFHKQISPLMIKNSIISSLFWRRLHRNPNFYFPLYLDLKDYKIKQWIIKMFKMLLNKQLIKKISNFFLLKKV